MKNRFWIPVLAAALLLGGMMTFGAPAQAQCLSDTECEALKADLQAFREVAKPLKQKARELRRQARDLPRGSEEWKALRRQVREIRRELRETRRDHEIRRTIKAYRDGCKRC